MPRPPFPFVVFPNPRWWSPTISFFTPLRDGPLRPSGAFIHPPSRRRPRHYLSFSDNNLVLRYRVVVLSEASVSSPRQTGRFSVLLHCAASPLPGCCQQRMPVFLLLEAFISRGCFPVSCCHTCSSTPPLFNPRAYIGLSGSPEHLLPPRARSRLPFSSFQLRCPTPQHFRLFGPLTDSFLPICRFSAVRPLKVFHSFSFRLTRRRVGPSLLMIFTLLGRCSSHRYGVSPSPTLAFPLPSQPFCRPYEGVVPRPIHTAEPRRDFPPLKRSPWKRFDCFLPFHRAERRNPAFRSGCIPLLRSHVSLFVFLRPSDAIWRDPAPCLFFFTDRGSLALFLLFSVPFAFFWPLAIPSHPSLEVSKTPSKLLRRYERPAGSFTINKKKNVE